MLSFEQRNLPVNIDTQLRLLGYDPQPVATRIEGREYVAPLSSNGVHTELKNMTEPALQIQNEQTPTQTLPSEFDWSSILDSKTKQSILTPVYSQYAVGRCYIIGPTQVLSDRLTIATKKLCPHISGFYFLSCGQKEQLSEGALGGSASYICDLLASIGNVSGLCSLGLWCFESPACIGGLATGQQLNTMIPPCSAYEPPDSLIAKQSTSTFQGYAPTCDHANGCCLDCISTACRQTGSDKGNGPRFKIDPTKTKRPTTIDEIKHDILTYGPIVTTFRVFNDLIVGALPSTKFPKSNQFQATNGVYVNVEGSDLYGLGSLPDGTNLSNVAAGNHTVSIVGWGQTQVQHQNLNQGQAFNLPYWIVRNSWGDLWMNKGYFKMAQTNMALGINARCALDLPIEIAPGVSFGGCISIQPAQETMQLLNTLDLTSVSFVMPITLTNQQMQHSQNTTLAMQASTSLSASQKEFNYQPLIITLASLVFLALIGIIIFQILKRK